MKPEVEVLSFTRETVMLTIIFSQGAWFGINNGENTSHWFLIKLRPSIIIHSYIVRVFSSSTRNSIGLLVKFIQDALCVIGQYMHG